MSNYEFSLSPSYKQEYKKRKYLMYFVFLPVALLMIFMDMDNPIQIILDNLPIVLGSLALFFIFTEYNFYDIKLIINEKGISCNRFTYDNILKKFKWKNIKEVIVISAQEDIKTQKLLGMNLNNKTNNQADELLYIPILKNNHFVIPISFSNKVWINSNIDLQQAIENSLKKSCIMVTAQEYQQNYQKQPQSLDKLLLKMLFISVIIIFVFLLKGML